MKVRAATFDDLDQIRALYYQLNPGDIKSPPDALNQIFEIITLSPWLTIYIGEVDKTVVASCYLNVIPNLTRGCSPYALIENVVTHKDHRRCGYGRRIVDFALRSAWQAGCYKAMLLTGSQNAIPFYEACGFVTDDKHGLVARPK